MFVFLNAVTYAEGAPMRAPLSSFLQKKLVVLFSRFTALVVKFGKVYIAPRKYLDTCRP